jgi:hypothetical protein
VPRAVDSANYSITINDLKNRWEWDPLRNDARIVDLRKRRDNFLGDAFTEIIAIWPRAGL